MMLIISKEVNRSRLDGEALDLVAHGADLASQLAGVVAGDAGGNDRAADTTGTAELGLVLDVDIRHVLVLSEERNVCGESAWLYCGIGRKETNAREWPKAMCPISILRQFVSIATDGLRTYSSENDELRNTAVQGLGSLVGTLLQLTSVGRRLDEIQELLLKLLVGHRPGCKRISTMIVDGSQ